MNNPMLCKVNNAKPCILGYEFWTHLAFKHSADIAAIKLK